MAIPIQVTFDCADPARVASFWAEALGYKLAEVIYAKTVLQGQ